ncbi:MAG: hypothetical protein RSD49_01460 [Hafnia sp.]
MIATDARHTNPLKALITLVVSMACFVWLVNSVFKFDLYEPVLTQLLKLWACMSLFIWVAFLLGKIAAHGAFTATNVIPLIKRSRNLFLSAAVLSLTFALAVFSANDFEGLWPTPIPVCSSLFLFFTLLSFRHSSMSDQSRKWFLLECLGLTIVYVITTEIYRHVLDLWANNLISIAILSYITLFTKTKLDNHENK